jgi:hypothetical protein
MEAMRLVGQGLMPSAAKAALTFRTDTYDLKVVPFKIRLVDRLYVLRSSKGVGAFEGDGL